MVTSIMRLGFVWFAIPYFGMFAYIAALIITNLIGSILNLRATIKATGMSIEIGDWLIKPLISALSGAIAAPVIKPLINSFIHLQPLAVLVSGCIVGGIMVIMLMLMGVFELKDLKQMLPFHIEKYRKF